MRQSYTWKLSRSSIRLGERTAIMGILNVTPDSFSDGGEYLDLDKAVDRGKEIEQEGADILDIGGESTRPGSVEISEDEELRRALPVVEKLAGVIGIPISIDTYRAAVARRALEAGAQVVNDISGLRFDSRLASAARDARAGLVLMHSRGARDALHKQARMQDPLKDVRDGLAAAVERAQEEGIEPASIVVDPGIGFGKAAEESVEVLKNLNEFSKLGHPLLVGTSRKSFIRSLVQDSLEARTWGTAATVVAAILKGAHIVRVHDVRQVRSLADTADGIIC